MTDAETRSIVRDYLLNHPDAIEDNGRTTIDVPVQFAHRAEITTRFLADWLAPREEG